MALPKNFTSLVSKIAKSGASIGLDLHTAGNTAVNKAYGDKLQGLEFAQHLIMEIPAYLRLPLAKWFNSCGIEVKAVPNMKNSFTVIQVRDIKNQAKAFKFAKENRVLGLTAVAKTASTTQELKGTAMERTIKSLQAIYKTAQTKNDDQVQRNLSACIAFLQKA